MFLFKSVGFFNLFFKAVYSNIEDILNAHKHSLNKFSIEVEDKHSKLPFLYFTAKMHKTLVSSRFITSSKFSSLSKLSEKVCMCLKTLLKSSKNYSNFDSKYKNYQKNYFIVDNNIDVIKFLEKSKHPP